MIDWLYPVGAAILPLPPVRLVCNVRGYWNYFPAYESVAEYHEARRALVDGALHAVASDNDDDVVILMQPVGAPWIEWLLPMEGWHTRDGPDPAWDPAVVAYAQLFTSGVLSTAYQGPCGTADLRTALDFCADLVIRNEAPESWLFLNAETSIAVYFHNTSSIGIRAPVSESVEAVMGQVRVPLLECQIFERARETDLESS